VDFYDVGSISTAKARLLDDSKLAKTTRSVKFQHVPTRRDGEGKLSREVGDTFLLFFQLDDNKTFDNLPRYVASGPDNMPSSRIFERDLKTLMKRLEDMSGQIAECKAGMLALSRDVSSLQIAARSAPVALLMFVLLICQKHLRG